MSDTTIVNRKTGDKYDVYIGRGSMWGNPFVIGKHGNRDEVISRYEDYIRQREDLLARLSDLKGKRLGCYCAPRKCHGDILIKLIDELEMQNNTMMGK